ncbi:phosphatidate cytidylyltransferase [Spiroplasma litorale]|uniref:Phosphatidate cytidylyltransferase n=1 Tax=Spiroplasma litorale TaxID=216942 RepID=A0A0K1W186_9MOLU|nr:phosphatidate cytidylyltransferase [Spiroplasma litorale]AKX33933.1 phosphatidate cytidylyltransferase [Spiroplasma litorale]
MENNQKEDLVDKNQEVGSNRFKSSVAISNFKKRIITSIILLIFLLIYVSLGAIYTLLSELKNIEIAAYFLIFLTSIILILCQFEINSATNFKKWYFQLVIISISLIMFFYPININLYRNLSFYSLMSLGGWLSSWQLPLIIFLFFLILLLCVYLSKSKNYKGIIINFAITLMIVFAFKAFTIISLSRIDFGGKIVGRFSFNTIVWVWLIIIFNDSFAYLGGMRWGKTKLAPVISPKKTWEGAAIGLSCSFIFAITYALIFYFCNPVNKPLFEMMVFLGNNSKAGEIIVYVILSLLFPVIGLYGDLLFSYVKRLFNIKDYSNLLPGHGGLLDRLDSIIFALFILFIIIILGSSVF